MSNKYNREDLPSSQYYRKALGSSSSSSNNNKKCQKCNEMGHWSYQCNKEQVYLYRPSRTKQLKNPLPLASIAPPSEDLTKKRTIDITLGQSKAKRSKKRNKSPSTTSSSDSETDSSYSSVSSSSSVSSTSSNSSSDSSEAPTSISKQRRSTRK